MSTLDAKLTNNCDDKLQEIDWEISKTNTDLEKFRKSGLPEAQSQIEALEQKLADLKKQREKIISETQSCLSWEKIDRTQLAKAQEILKEQKEYIPTKDEEKRKKAIEIASEVKNPEDIQDLKIEWWVLWIFLQILKAMFWWKWEMQDGKVNQTQNENEVINETKTKLKSPERRIGKFDFYTLIETKEWEKFKKYEDLILKWTNRIWNINPGLLLQLMIKEWSNGNISAWPWWKNSALWLWQITDDTWIDICNKIWPKQYWIYIDKSKWRYDAESQIKAMCIYLDYCARVREVNHANAILYYHQWPGKINDNTARKNLSNNPAIAKHHKGNIVTVASYEEAAKNYYLW